jgi:hypothetical protein
LIRFAYSRCENYSKAERTHLHQYIGGTIVYFLNRQGGSNLRIFWEVNFMSLIQKVNLMRQYIGAVTAVRNIFTPLRLFIQTSPNNLAVTSGNGNRFFTQKLHVQIKNKLRSPQCQTKVQ